MTCPNMIDDKGQCFCDGEDRNANDSIQSFLESEPKNINSKLEQKTMEAEEYKSALYWSNRGVKYYKGLSKTLAILLLISILINFA